MDTTLEKECIAALEENVREVFHTVVAEVALCGDINANVVKVTTCGKSFVG